MYYAYIRVSTKHQIEDNQLLEIKKYCKYKRITWKYVTVITEKISGTKSYEKRELGKLIEKLQEDDVLIITELSRLGRSLMMIFDILNKLLSKGVKVYAIKENYELGDNIQSQVLAFAFGLSAQIERDLISERTKMGLERARKEGKHIGRMKGVSYGCKLDGKERKIKMLLKSDKSFRAIARELGVSASTLYSFCKAKKIKYDDRK